ncbi:opioid-binding protein/cell adhesion molecule [Elysia marginata]|uniref:Opioid-binding protein/cell adhesion molecule n=1 Tax=Elysia marginata TaxID=1093978 RepID=A0AAV4JBA2_9GAST|nr:opioid-binding protein/cell adhesion molecule [Elysia marginata]
MSHADSRLIDDSRISVERGHPSVWNLLIREVRHNDSGTYECRTNTDPIQTKKITLDVRVPPSIIDTASTDELTVVEGNKITLICNVTGIPPPNVTWWQRVPGESRKKRKFPDVT